MPKQETDGSTCHHIFGKKSIIFGAIAIAAIMALGAFTAVADASDGVYFLDTFDDDPVLADTQTPDAWYPDRRAPDNFSSALFDGDNRLRVSINDSDQDSNSFYNYQGRKYDLHNPVGSFITIDLYIGPEWETENRHASLWATTFNETDGISGYPIFGFTNGSGFKIYSQDVDQDGEDTDGDGNLEYGWYEVGFPDGFSYDEWYTLRIELTETAYNYYIDGDLVWSDSITFDSTYLGNMMLQAYNYGEDYDVYWDNVRTCVHEIWVDDDAASGWYDWTHVSSIQTAVDRVCDGGTVNVAAGTYDEQLNISKPVTIIGAGTGSTIITNTTTLTDYFTTPGSDGTYGTADDKDNYPIVYIHETNDVVIQDLTIDGAGNGNSNYRYEGVGINDSAVTLTNVELKAVRDTPFSGAQHGTAIYAYNTAGTDRIVKIENCNIYDFQKNAMALIGDNCDCIVQNNTITGAGKTDVTAQNGIQFSGGATGIADNNTVADIWYTGGGWAASGGIMSSSDGAIVSNNSFDNIHYALYVSTVNNVLVENNEFTDCEAILFYPSANGCIFRNNTVDNVTYGLWIYDSTDLTVDDNDFTDCSYAIILGGTSTAAMNGNTFSGNYYTIYHAATIVGSNDYWSTIQNAIDNTTVGDTVEVYAGTFEENVVVDEDITLTGANSPDGPNAAIVSGVADSTPTIRIAVDGVTVSNLNITNTGHSGEIEAIFVGNPAGYTDDPAKTIEISNNVIDSVNSTDTNLAVEGIHVKSYGGNQINGVLICDNVIRNISQPDYGCDGIKLQADLDNVEIRGNTIEDVSGYWTYGVVATPASLEPGFPKNVVVEYNNFSAITAAPNADWATAVAVDTLSGDLESGTIPDATQLAVHYNNFEDVAYGVVNKDQDEILDATYNWWGASDGPGPVGPGSGVGVGENVTYCPWLRQSVPDGLSSEVYVDDDWAGSACMEEVEAGKYFGLNAFATIQNAIDHVFDSTVYVAAGTYTPSSTITIDKSLTLLGPQAGVDPRPFNGSTRTPGDASEAVVDGGGTLETILYVAADDVTVDGLEIAHGTGDLVYSNSPATQGTVFKNCIVHDSSGDEGVQFKHCTDGLIWRNYIYDVAQDGANFGYSTDCTIADNEITGSTSENGALFVYDSTSITVEGNYMHDNTAANGIMLYHMEGGSHTVQNNLIVGNTWTGRGKHDYTEADGNSINLYKEYVAGATYTVYHNTVADNYGSYDEDGYETGHAVYIKKDEEATYDVYNNIFADNEGYGIKTWNSPTVNYGYNDFFNNENGSTDGVPTDTGGNIYVDPLFEDPGAMDYHLQTGSPCRDVGTNLGVAEDIMGDSRDTLPDMGAYEYIYVLDFTTLDLEYSTDLSTWHDVTGDYPDYELLLDRVVEFYYLDVASAATNVQLADGSYGFYLDTSSVPGGFYAYWESRGVYEGCSGPWEPAMWNIISGSQPMFYLEVSGGGTSFTLVDGLQGSGNPLRVNGEYPLGDYVFNGEIESIGGVTNDISVEMSFAEAREPDDDWNYWDNSPHIYNENEGNVGVGTETPEEQLHVYGGFRVDGSSSHLFFVDNISGNVGIGTDSPTAKLDVAGSVKMTGFQLTQGTVLDGWVLTAQGPNGVGEWEPLSDSLPPEMVNGSGTPGWVPFYKDADSLADSPIFTAGGEIGIGGAPTDRFTLYQQSDYSGFRINGHSSSEYGKFYINPHDSWVGQASNRITYSTQNGYIFYNSAHDVIYNIGAGQQFRIRDSGSNELIVVEEDNGLAKFNYGGVFNELGGSTDFRVESSGNSHMLFVDGSTNNVGIGTDTPEHALHVDGAINLDPIAPPTPPTSGFVIFCNENDGNLYAMDSTGSTTRMVTGP